MALADDLTQLDGHGFLVVHDLVPAEALATIHAELAPWSQQRGRNPFEGTRTERVYSLLAKTRAFDALIEHPRVLAICHAVLSPSCLLSAALTVKLLPGEQAQSWHADGAFYGVARPRPPIGISTVWALDDFTTENGATEILPGSHRWAAELPAHSEGMPVLLRAGSVVIYPDTLYHRAGANRSQSARLGVTIQYCAAWARPIETMLLAVPPPLARGLSPRIQSLLGYSVHPPFVGYVNGMHPRRVLERPWREAGEKES